MSRNGVEVVEGDLLPVDVEPAYDGHRDLLKLRIRGPPAPASAYAVNRDAHELRRSPPRKATAHLSPADACHLYVRGPRNAMPYSDPR